MERNEEELVKWHEHKRRSRRVSESAVAAANNMASNDQLRPVSRNSARLPMTPTSSATTPHVRNAPSSQSNRMISPRQQRQMPITPAVAAAAADTQTTAQNAVVQMIKKDRETFTILDFDLDSIAGLHCFIDFSKSDALRNRALIVENRTLYVCDYYMSIWSPVFRDMFFGVEKCSKEVFLANKRYVHILEYLECIAPQQKEINESNLNVVLPLAFEYQSEGLLNRCIAFIRKANMKLMDKLYLADVYNLAPLMGYCLRQLRTTAQVDFNSPHYNSLSDRTKVRMLEKLQNCRTDYLMGTADESIPEIDNTEPNPVHFSKFTQKSELFFGIMRVKNGRYFYCNPYYAAAWCHVIAEQVTQMSQSEINTNLTEEEAVEFLLACHPPLLTLSDVNASTILKAACKLESPGMVRKCSSYMLLQSASSDLYEMFALFDRCYLHELLEPCLRRARDLQVALKFASHPSYDCLSTKAKSCILDRIAVLFASEPELSSHYCEKCRKRCQCSNLKWVCPHCGTYHSGEKLNIASRPF